ncbi:hypothetical protein K2X85_09805 [bacterium]|nr:hypothetical protein [bacterium]
MIGADAGGWTLARQSVRSMSLFLAIAVVFWLFFWLIWTELPFLRNGTRVIVDAKREFIAHGHLFDSIKPAPNRVAFFGHSRVLSGFIPDLFDSLSQGRTESYNLGMPGEAAFLPRLEEVLAAGHRPTHVFLILAWPADEFTPSIWRWFGGDQPLIEKAFPFQPLARDAIAFLARAPSQGGIRAFYRHSQKSAEKTIADRGYYFIESQSLFSDHRLPENYNHPSDHPDRIDPREVPSKGAPIERIARLAQEHHFRVILVPNYRREKQAGPPPSVNEKTLAALRDRPLFDIVGPDYIRYPNALFSDRVHLNPDGADRYTRDLWEVTQHLFSNSTGERDP